jgi:hypothetical protein
MFNSATRRTHDERFKEEIEGHIALQTEGNLRAGLSPAESRRQAMLKFGAMEAIEWPHAMSPNAKIVLVEAATNSFAGMFAAVDVATAQVQANGIPGEVSMSWGGSEFSSEASNDGHFQHSNVAYFAASGDTDGVNIYPSVSPFVVSAGGTV